MSKMFIYSCAIILILLIKQSNSFSYQDSGCGNDDDEDQFLIEEFKRSVEMYFTKDYMNSTPYLLRWLKDSNCDLDLATEKFRKFVEWRKKNNVDSIFLEDFSNIEPHFVHGIEGFDKDGRLILWNPTTGTDFRKITLAGEAKKCIRMVVRNLELIETIMYEEGKKSRGRHKYTAQYVGLFDVQGFSVQKAACLGCLQILSAFLTINEEYYPMGVYKAYFINSPKVFDSTMTFMRGFLSDYTKNAFIVFDFNKEKWSSALLEQINKEDLSEEYGGTKSTFIINGQSYSPKRGRVVLFKTYLEKAQQDFKQEMAKRNNQRNSEKVDVDDSEFGSTTTRLNLLTTDTDTVITNLNNYTTTSTTESLPADIIKAQMHHHHHYSKEKYIKNPKCDTNSNAHNFECSNETIISASSGADVRYSLLIVPSLTILILLIV